MRMSNAVRLPLIGIALLPLSALLTAPASADASTQCACDNVKSLQQELRNAMTLRQRHADKQAELIRKYGANPKGGDLLQANNDYKNFEEGSGPGTAIDGITATVPGAPTAIGYVPRGQALQEAHAKDPSKGIPLAEKWVNDILVPDLEQRARIEAEYRAKGQDLCEHQDAKAVESSAKASAACAGIARILIEHEASHQATCRKMGYYAFAERKPAERAADEVVAYDKQIAQLTAELQKVLASKKTRIKNKPLSPGVEGLLAAQTECVIAVKVVGQIDDLKLTGTICDTAQESKLKGNLPINFTLTPTDTYSGAYAYRGRAAGTDFWGSGGYAFELNDGKGTLTLDGSGRWWAKNPAGQASKGGPETLKATEIKEGC